MNFVHIYNQVAGSCGLGQVMAMETFSDANDIILVVFYQRFPSGLPD
jgi:hypothetical protein